MPWLKALAHLGLWGWALFALASCQQEPPASAQQETILPSSPTMSTITVSETQQATSIASPTKSPASATPSSTIMPVKSFCSPLQGFSLEQVSGLVSNPFNPPAPGSDDPHQGVDLAVRLEGSQVALAGSKVNAVLDGRVAAVLLDRFPYGNALLVETPLSDVPETWADHFGSMALAPAVQPDPELTCPEVLERGWDLNRPSLYVLYAHLLAAPVFNQADEIGCGQEIGTIGQSGNALNPHLHLEVRLGPAEARFDSLAHYDNSASLSEMDAYCTWRVRGLFQVVDPLRLLTGQP